MSRRIWTTKELDDELKDLIDEFDRLKKVDLPWLLWSTINSAYKDFWKVYVDVSNEIELRENKIGEDE